jgi:ribosome-associated protein
MIQITSNIAIDENEIHQEFIQSSGPGGQNVNKVATAVQLRFDVANSPSLPDEVRERLLSLTRRRITKEGVLVIDARRFRTQGANRQDAMERLVGLIRKAAQKPRIRRKTRPTLGSKMRRLEAKRRRAQTKRLRSQIPEAADG